MKRALSLTTLIVAVTLALAGCGNNGADGASDTSVTHNQQDVAFAINMIPHHLHAFRWPRWLRPKLRRPP